MRAWKPACLTMILLWASGCATNPHAQVFESSSAVKLRSHQTRAFDTSDRKQTLRTVVATLQDLGFVIDKADATLNAVTATKLEGHQIRISVTIRPRGESQLLVRANAQLGLSALEDPEAYQRFFVALEKSMFLAAHSVD